ncbi:MAG: class I adenylate-forming enzyme family protein [Acetobacteraceae bacterium]
MIHTDLIAPVGALLRRQASARGDRIAYEDARRSVTYAALERRTAALAVLLQEMGLRMGQSVALLLPNSVAWVEACLAILRAGGVVVPISYDATEPEIGYRLADADCRVAITTEAGARRIAGLMPAAAAGGGMILTGETGDFAVAAERTNDVMPDGATPGDATSDGATPRDPDDLDATAFIVYTSGTTGRAKGVMLSLRGMLWVNAACWVPIAGLSAEDHVLSPLPLFHSYALNLSVLAIMATGARAYIMERFSTTEMAALLARGTFTVLPGVPTMFHYLLDTFRAAGNRDAGRVRLCISAGAILPGPLNRDFEDWFAIPLLDGYGITETATMVTMNWPVGTRIPGSCGLPLPGLTVRLVDPATDADAAPGEEGELIVRGPGVMQGYWNKPAETAAALRQGWYRTGDLARGDASGFLTITGRLKELIIRGGQNIAPAEVEEAVIAFPAVRDCAVVGMPHHHLGEVPVAFVVLREGAALDPAALLAHCRDRLSAYKVPHAIRIVAEIPRTGSGKVMRFKLREALDGASG